MRRALLVGIDDYSRDPLFGCVNDATSMRDIPSRNQDGSPNFGCKLLTAPHEQTNRSLLRENIEEIFAVEAYAALFCFSGHGTVNNLGGYLVTQDTKSCDEGVAMSEVIARANSSKCDKVVIILDCCHSGALGNVPEINNDQVILREGVSILTGSRAKQPTMEEDGKGIFTKLVHHALDGGAADVCGNVTVAAIYAYVDQTLGAWDQRPLFKSHVSRLIPLRQCNQEVELSTLRRLPEYFPGPCCRTEA